MAEAPATAEAPVIDGAARPLIEVVVPTLDSHPLLPRLVASLQAQSWPHWRLHFIDGPSGATHRRVLEQLCAADSRLRWSPQAPQEEGIFGAMNQGAAAAPANAWLLFWGSDDWAASRTVLAQLAERLGPQGAVLASAVVGLGLLLVVGAWWARAEGRRGQGDAAAP